METSWATYLNRFNNVNPIGLFDYDFNDRTRNNGKKINSEAIQYISSTAFSPINITTTWNAVPHDVVNSGTVNTFKNHLDAHWEDNPQMCWSTGNTDDDPSLTWTAVVPTWLRTNRHTTWCMSTHSAATPPRHKGMTQLSISLLEV